MKIRDSLFDLFGCGVAVYCRCGQQTYVNPQAKNMMRNERLGQVVQRAISGSLRRSLANGEAAVGPDMIEAECGDSMASVMVSVTRIPREPDGCPDTEEFVCRLVDLNHGVILPPEPLAGLFRLSCRESQVASHLIKPNMADADIAKAIGVSINTVKSHIKKIYIKTNSNSRGELVRKLMLAHMLIPTKN
jgi:DNA-binding CsgD family transcriptional regulator